LNVTSIESEASQVVVQHGAVQTVFFLPKAHVDHIQKIIATQCQFYEIDLLEHMLDHVKPGELVLDVGANIGNHTLFFANVCKAQVVALEPNAEAYAILERNVALNGLGDRVTLKQVAAGRAASTGKLIVDPTGANLGQARVDAAEPGDAIIQRLDDLELPTKVRAIKIDVEGMELDVLLGAEELLKRDRPLVYVECATQKSLALVVEYLTSLGFAANAHFNVTTTVLFLPREAGTIELNQQLALHQHETQARFEAAHRVVNSGFRRMHDDLTVQKKALDELGAHVAKNLGPQLAKSVEPLRAALSERASVDVTHTQILRNLEHRATVIPTLDERARTILRVLNELGSTLTRQEQQLATLSQQVSVLRTEQARFRADLDVQRKKEELEGRPLLTKLARKSAKLLKNPEAFFRDAEKGWAGHAERAYGGLWKTFGGEQAQRRMGRRIAKFQRNPDAFFRDSDHYMVRVVGRWLYKQGARPQAKKSKIEKRKVVQEPVLRESDYALVRVSVVLAMEHFDKSSAVHLEKLCSATDPADEVVLVTSSRTLIRELALWTSTLRANRVRAYFFPEPVSADERIRYGLDRALGDHVVIADQLSDTLVNKLKTLAAPAERTSPCVLRANGSGEALAVLLSRQLCRDTLKVMEHVSLRGLRDAVASQHRLTEIDVDHNARTSVRPPARNHEAPVIPLFCPRGRASSLIEELAAKSQHGERFCLFTPADDRIRDELAETDVAGTVELVDLDAFPELFVYPMPARQQPFTSGVRADSAVCIERKPGWLRPMQKAHRLQREKISVVMTLYNAQETVGFAIDSILQQTHSNLELIVVDDCSTDGSLEIALAKAKHDRRIRVLRAPRNSGTYWCKNFGITRATGEYIAFQDSDDLSLAPRLEVQLGMLRRERELGGCVTYHQRLKDEGHAHWIGEYKDRLCRITLLIRSSVIQEVGFFDTVRFSADDEFLGRIRATNRRVVRIPISYYLARHAEGSLTTAGAGAIIQQENVSVVPPARKAYHEAAELWHKRISRGDLPFVEFPLRKRPFPVPAEMGGEVEKDSSLVTVSLATMPSRVDVLEKTIQSLLPQADRINVYLNNFSEVPAFLQQEKITIARSQDFGDLKDNGKFFFMRRDATGYQFTVDDDIQYPPDYVRKMILTIERYHRKAAIGVHGVNLDPNLVRYTKGRRVFHFKEEQLTDRCVQLVGTGTLAFHASTMSVDYTSFESTGVADLWFAVRAREQNVALISLARPNNWLKPLEHQGETIFAAASRDDAKETALAHRFGPWNDEAMAEPRRTALAPYANNTLRELQAAGVDVHEMARLRGLPRVKLVVLVTGWNCADHVLACWKSIARQQPGHYDLAVHFVDDGSEDGTWEAMQALPRSDVLRLRRHDVNMGPAFSRWEVIREITDRDAVCVIVDMDDELLPSALARIAEAYLSDENCWLTAGNWRNQRGKPNPLDFYPEAVLETRCYRKLPSFRIGHVRSFKRFLADRLSDDNFKGPDGEWLMFCTDVALMFPLVEQCGPENVTFIRDHLYLYNEWRPGGTLARFGKPKKAHVYRWLRDRPQLQP
jgi:FkbM family methyltransferase